MAKRSEKSAPQKTSDDSGQGAGGSRSRTRERRLEREREQRRRRQLTVAGVVGAVAVIVMVLLVIANQPAEAPIPEEAVARYSDLPQQKTAKGYPQLGDPDASVQVVEYSSFDCTSCGRFHDEAFPRLVERVKAGDISFTYVPLFGTGSVQNGQGAARAAICAGEQGSFWPIHDALFTWQTTYGNQAFTQNRLLSGLANLGVDRGRYDQCLGSGLPDNVLDSAEADKVALGTDYRGTPTVIVNGINPTPQNSAPTLDIVNAAIDTALAQVGPRLSPEETAEATVEAPESTAEVTREAVNDSASEAVPESSPTAGS